MKNKSLSPSLALIFVGASLPVLWAQDGTPRPTDTDRAGWLREALFQEEAVRDLGKAVEGYEKVIEAYEKDREFAATALFRLAEVKRKQQLAEEAIRLYRRVLQEFPQHEPLARLSEENLVALGESPGEASNGRLGFADEESRELARLRGLAKNSPDRLANGESNGETPLHIAARKGQLRVAAFLLENGAPIDHQEPTKGTALAVAARWGHKAMCELLLDKGANPNLSSPLGEAIVGGRAQTASLLLEKGADPNAIANRKTSWIANPITRKSAPKAFTMIGLATYLDHLPYVTQLLDAGADPNRVPPNEFSALCLAIRERHTNIAELLIERGADINAIHQGMTALHFAVSSQLPQLVAALIEDGARVDIEDRNGAFPIHFAARQGWLEYVKLLAPLGATIDTKNTAGVTPLDAALRANQWDCALFLLANGANPDLEIEGQSIYERAPAAMRVQLVRSNRYPIWNKLPAITLSLPDDLYKATLAEGSGAPPNLANLLLTWHKQSPQGLINSHRPWTSLIIFRNSPKEMIETPISHEQPMPELEWGDVIELVPSNDKGRGQHTNDKLDPGALSFFESIQSLKVIVHLNGEAHELTLRGRTKSYNPLGLEAPLVTLDRLMPLLGIDPGSTLRVERAGGGGTFEAILGQPEAVFVLEEGDHVHVTPNTEESENLRTQHIFLRSPGRLFGNTFSRTEPSGDRTPPSLLQLIAWQYAPLPMHELDFLRRQLQPDEPLLWKPERITPLLAAYTHATPRPMLPFPDWSKIRIRRMDPEGQEISVEVNLRETWEKCQDDTPATEARTMDLPLEWGDIVEVPILEHIGDREWSTLDPGLIRLMKKALERQVIYENRKRVLIRATVDYVPSYFHHTECGLVPVPTEKRVQGKVDLPRAANLVRSMSEGAELLDQVQRPDVGALAGRNVWLEDGDRVTGRQRQSITPRSTRSGARVTPSSSRR